VYVCDGSGVDGQGQDYTSDLCAYYTLHVHLCDQKWSQIGNHFMRQLKWMQTGSSCWSGCNKGAAAELDTIGEQLLKWTQSGSIGSGHERIVLTLLPKAVGASE